ncbi:MAG: hypothetical protein ACI915_005049 [Gammaproteobacteria bacterium]|jgi:hypothetical protein
MDCCERLSGFLFADPIRFRVHGRPILRASDGPFRVVFAHSPASRDRPKSSLCRYLHRKLPDLDTVIENQISFERGIG